MYPDRYAAMKQTSFVIACAMNQYATYHDHYPDGKSSTEVFQKLLDGGYITDPSTFYFSMTGKTKPITGQPLKPENVCWDVTSPVDSWAPKELPLVFSTGYKVNYVPGGAAVPLVKPYPKYFIEDPRNWRQRLQNYPPLDDLKPGIVVWYKSAHRLFMPLTLSISGNSEDSIPNFVPADFDAKGKTYRQLTPDGPLP